MTRVEFLTELDHRLSALSKEEADKYLDYYAEMLADRMEDGMSEEEAVASMESVEGIARRILGTAYTTPKKKETGRRAMIVAMVAVAAVFLVVTSVISLVTCLFGFNRVGMEHINTNTGSNSVVIEELPVVDYADEYTTLIEPQNITAINVLWVSGAVYVEVWDESEIGVCEYGQDIVKCESRGGTLYVNYESELFEDSTGDLTIILPRDFAENLLDEISISVTSADVTLSGVNARKLSITNVSGYIQADGRFGDVFVGTTSGDVSLSGSMESITINAVSGYVFLYCDDALRELEADSVSGDVTLCIPVDLGFALEFDSISGSACSDLFDVYGEEAKFTHGDGEVQLRVDTVSGCFFLERE